MNIFALSGILIAVTSAAMFTAMIFLGRARIHYLWALVCFAVFIWGIGTYQVATIDDADDALLWWKITHFGVILIPVTFYHFVHEFTKQRAKIILILSYIASGIFLYLNFFTNLFIADVRFVFDQFYYDSPPGPFYPLFTFFFFVFVVLGHYLLIREYRRSASNRKRTQILYFFSAMAIGYIGGGLSFLPVFGIDIYPYGNLAVSLYPIIMGYAILKYRLMDFKVFSSQIFVFLLVLLTLIRIFLSNDPADLVFNISFLVLALLLGIFLVRSVLHEIDAREKLEKANEDLKKRSELKTEFVSVATHQIRSPLTAIKGYVSMIQEGSFGEVPEKMKRPLDIIFISAEGLVHTVQDFLDTSRIEQGRMKYDMRAFSFKKMVEEVIAEQEQIIEESGLNFSFESEDGDEDGRAYTLVGDRTKLKQVVNNLVDNALKYTKTGFMHVRLSHSSNAVRFEVEDSGIGMSEATRAALFKKFSRAEDADEANVMGTGLGLYIAKTIVEAHGGRIWVESEGEGKGSRFVVEVVRRPPGVDNKAWGNESGEKKFEEVE